MNYKPVECWLGVCRRPGCFLFSFELMSASGDEALYTQSWHLLHRAGGRMLVVFQDVKTIPGGMKVSVCAHWCA